MAIDLNAIRKRAEAATEGPWTTFDDVQYIARRTVYEYDEWTESNVDVIADCSHMHDATFIAHARQDVPALVAEVERLRAGIDRFLYDMSNEDYTDPHVVEAIAEDLRKVYLGKEDD
jgi:hypothetical protein